MIDWLRVDALRTEVGDDAFHEVVDLFLQEVDEVVARLAVHADPAQYEHDLHFLKGSSMNLGFRGFSLMCEGGEKLAAMGRADAVDIQTLVSYYHSARQTFVPGLRERGIGADGI